MTMPHEYTRALRWGWEFLWELKDSAEVPAEIRDQAAALLGHYPSTSEIHEWVEHVSNIDMFGSMTLGPEESTTSHPEIPTTIKRPLISREQYVHAISEAGILFVQLRGDKRLPEELSRQVPYVLRHYPCPAVGGMSAEWVVPKPLT
jgi:hypothetical protein